MWKTFLWVTLACWNYWPLPSSLEGTLDSYQLMNFFEPLIMFIIISVKSWSYMYYSTNFRIMAFPWHDLWLILSVALSSSRSDSGLVWCVKPEFGMQSSSSSVLSGDSSGLINVFQEFNKCFHRLKPGSNYTSLKTLNPICCCKLVHWESNLYFLCPFIQLLIWFTQLTVPLWAPKLCATLYL